MALHDLSFTPTPAPALHWRNPTGAIGGATYEEVARWNIGSSGSSQNAEYWNGGGLPGTHNYAASFFTSTTSLSGANLLTAPSAGTYRARVVGGTLDGVSQVGAIERFRQPDSSVRRAWRIGNDADFRAVWGATSIATGGGVLILERQVTAHSPPNIDTARWAALSPTAWSGTAAYPTIGTLVTNGGLLFSSLAAIPAPSGGQTYTQVFDFPAGGSTNVTQNVADYIGHLAAYRNAVCVNQAHDSLLVAGNTYRIRRASGTAAAMTGVTGVLSKQTAPYGGSGYVCFRIGTEADMGAAFGTGSNITTGANWILESVSGSPQTPNSPPETDTARWSQLVTSAWSATAGYLQNAIVTAGSPSAYYRATTNIAAIGGTENDYRLRVTPAHTPTPPTAPAWDGQSAYPANSEVVYQNTRYRALNNIAAGTPAVPTVPAVPAVPPTYEAIVNTVAPAGHPTAGNWRIATNGLSIAQRVTGGIGTQPPASILAQGDIIRARRIHTGFSPNWQMATVTSVAQTTGGGFNFEPYFGTTTINLSASILDAQVAASGSFAYEVERQTAAGSPEIPEVPGTPAVDNPAPPQDTANWAVVPPPSEVAASLAWIRRTALATGNRVLSYDDAGNGSFIWRSVA